LRHPGLRSGIGRAADQSHQGEGLDAWIVR
jgi:hypothetical protein